MQSLIKREPKARELVWIARFSNACVLIIALWIMIHLQSIQAAWHITLLFGSGLGSVLVLRWLWYRINLWSEISAAVVSLILAPLLLWLYPSMHEGLSMLILATVSTVVVVIVTLVTPCEPKKTLKAFYDRVRPPGFWKAISQDNTSSLRFWRALFALFLAATTVFSLLIGSGMLFTNALLQIDSATPYLLLGIGIVLVPFWKRLGC